MQLAEAGSPGLLPKSLPGGSQDCGHGGPQLGGDRSDVLDILHQSRLDDAMSGTRGKTYLNRAGRVEGHSGGLYSGRGRKDYVQFQMGEKNRGARAIARSVAARGQRALTLRFSRKRKNRPVRIDRRVVDPCMTSSSTLPRGLTPGRSHTVLAAYL